MHQETVRIVDTQMSGMSTQMAALDDFVAKARSQNGRFYESHLDTLNEMTENVHESHVNVHGQLDGLTGRVGKMQSDVDGHTANLAELLAPLHTEVRQPLSDMRSQIRSHSLKEYVPTGITPQKRRYEYPSDMPQTDHDGLRSRRRMSKGFTTLPFNEDQEDVSSSDSPPVASSAKKFVYNDTLEEVGHPLPSAATPSNTGLREVDRNVARPVVSDVDEAHGKFETPAFTPPLDLDETPEKEESEQPTRKRRRSNSTIPAESKLPKTMLSKKMAGMMEGRENLPPSAVGGRRFKSRSDQA